ncbi:MAG: universal stress protein [Saprospiraceae bacterium]|nr:universal stress protein [Saprospiraceae bacterium]
MKHLLVPTDFSVYANFAKDLAIKLATRSNGNITLLHTVDVLPSGWEQLSDTDQQATIKIDEKLSVAHERMLATQRDAKELGINLQISFRGGKLWEAIDKLVTSQSIDQIVMGSHGVSGKEEFFIGSNTQKVVRNVNCDVLIIKNKIPSIHFPKVVFATGLDISEQPIFQRFLQMLSLFDTEEVHILTVNTPGFFSQPTVVVQESLKDFANMVSDFKCETHFISDITVDAGVRNFNEKIEADLMAISDEGKNSLIRMFTGSNVEFLVNHAEVPVLVLKK